jgi:uncharacterized protein (TIGR00255 family)
MIRSMTGFGKSSCDLEKKSVSIEIKSLNSRQTDIYTRLPNLIKEKDLEIRNEIIAYLKRGKIEITVNIDSKEGDLSSNLNVTAIKKYYEQFREISTDLGFTLSDAIMQSILRLPESLNSEKEELDDAEWQEILKTLKEALNETDKFRVQEGNAMEADIKERIALILQYLEKIGTFEGRRTENIRNRLKDNMNEFINQDNVDENRFEQELIYYLEKLDITEEKVRLKNHCGYFLEVIKEEEPVGKKLGFVTQEIGREINTIGSKANDSDIQKLVVMMKDELEKVKEQLMNIL